MAKTRGSNPPPAPVYIHIVNGLPRPEKQPVVHDQPIYWVPESGDALRVAFDNGVSPVEWPERLGLPNAMVEGVVGSKARAMHYHYKTVSIATDGAHTESNVAASDAGLEAYDPEIIVDAGPRPGGSTGARSRTRGGRGASKTSAKGVRSARRTPARKKTAPKKKAAKRGAPKESAAKRRSAKTKKAARKK